MARARDASPAAAAQLSLFGDGQAMADAGRAQAVPPPTGARTATGPATGPSPGPGTGAVVEAADAPPHRTPYPRPRPGLPPSGPVAPAAPVRPALDPAATAPPPDLPPNPPPPQAHGGAVLFRHPRASREIRLGDAVVAYELTRARRRSIGMVVSSEGLSVRAPRWVTVAEIESALLAKAGWIRGKLADQRERARRGEAARIEWADGVSLPFLGETVILVLDERVTGAVLHSDVEALPGVPKLTLHLGLPHTAAPAQIRDAVQAWLQRQARRVFEERCAHYAARLGVRVTRLQLSNAQTRWGSASADGSIRLNWRLIHLSMATIDYVVAHELAHLREMNHSPRFWDVVRSVIPDVDRVRQGLRNEVLPDLGG